MSSYYKARKTLANVLKRRGCNATFLTMESEFEVDVMASNQALNFAVNGAAGGKVYVHFDTGSSALKRDGLGKLLEEKYEELSASDCLCVLHDVAPSGPFMDARRQIWTEKGLFVQSIPIARLQYDITDHVIVPPHRILTPEEISTKDWGNDLWQLPLIDREDAMAVWLGARPDQVVEILRPSPTVGTAPYFRLCVNRVN